MDVWIIQPFHRSTLVYHFSNDGHYIGTIGFQKDILVIQANDQTIGLSGRVAFMADNDFPTDQTFRQ